MVAQFNDFEISSVHEGDAWEICDLCVANTDRFKRYFSKTLAQNLNPTLSQYFVDKKVKQFEDKVEFLFTLKQSKTRKLMGLIYIKELDWGKKQGEFAYCIDYNFEKKGLISKSIKVLSEYAFKNLGLETLQIISHKTNLRSIKIAEKNNFKWIKTLKGEYTPPNEQPLDMELFELYDER
ncbi:MAG: GNAT family N-acetyltransferase [Winogradskyella sp.]|uniref:GNAT family N-acetyltransferase n=1 Tax=Winogradskyella sp. TaxID=1883156 RepID=UPI00180F6C0B|nr:GNAT family protein [Winogradskyella sp.]MBT8244435.1 GNAT family N-acetyltransferase [Winogradskyella sp.]NNK22537.1 GNAT family N-acetyltransferase [Winogradskyella sp.]